MAVYITGDTHGDFRRFSARNFNAEPGSFIIICGDFGGVWIDSENQKYWLNWLAKKPYEFAFVDGNHENFDMLSTFPIVEWHGGKTHEIRPNIHHMMRGEIFNIEEKTFWAFGGARSHDIDGGLFEPYDVDGILEAKRRYESGMGGHFRIKGASWWEQEMPNEEEFKYGEEQLEKANWNVDFIVTHDAPMTILALRWPGCIEPDKLNNYFNDIVEKTKFSHWYAGHHHVEEQVMGKFTFCYEKIFQIA